MNFEVSLAKPDDIHELSGLLIQLFSSEPEFTPDRKKQEAGLSLILKDPGIGEIFVMKIDGKIRGMVSLLYTISTALGGKVAVLEDMVVDESSRALGLGTKLLEEAVSHAKKRNCLRITLLTEAANKGAIRFYKRQGFNDSTMIPLRLVF